MARRSGILMNPLVYLKAVIGAVGANVFPPICEWLVTFIPGNPPNNVRDAISLFLVALLTGGAVYATPNHGEGSASTSVNPTA
jgi:hypothetical protein